MDDRDPTRRLVVGLALTGSATGLFGRWLLWLLLIVVTVGIYSFWVIPRLTKWKVEQQAFEW